MTIKESYKLAKVIQKLRDEKRLSLVSAIRIAIFLRKHTPRSFSTLHWLRVVNRKVLYEFKYLDRQ